MTKTAWRIWRVYFTARDQEIVDNAVSVRARRAEVITTYIDVEALPFNRGYYSCDLTFFFEISVDVYTGRTCPCTTVTGVGVFQKKVILYGSEGNVKVFSSEYREDDCDAQELPTRNLPRCVVHVAEPVVLSARIAEPCSCGCCDCGCGCRLRMRLHPGPHLQPLRRQFLRQRRQPQHLCYAGHLHHRAADPQRPDAGAGVRFLHAEQGVQLPGHRQPLRPVPQDELPGRRVFPAQGEPRRLRLRMQLQL